MANIPSFLVPQEEYQAGQPLGIASIVNPALNQNVAPQTPALKKALGKNNPAISSGKGGPIGKDNRKIVDDLKSGKLDLKMKNRNAVEKLASGGYDEQIENNQTNANATQVANESDAAIAAANPPEKTREERLMEWMQKFGGAPAGAEINQRSFANLVPEPQDFMKSFLQGEAAYTEAMGGEGSLREDRGMDAELLKASLKEYLTKANNPYRGVDLESIDKLGASAFGSRVRGMKNVADPINEFNQLTGVVKDIQTDKKFQANEILDYMKNVLKPQYTGEISYKKPAPQRATGGPTASTQQNASKFVFGEYNKIDTPAQKLIQNYGQIRANLKQGTVASVKSSLALLARTVGSDVGNIAVSEADRYIQSTLGTNLANLESWVTNNPDVKVPPEVVQSIGKYVASAEKEVKDRVARQFKNLDENFSKDPYFADANSRFAPQYINKQEFKPLSGKPKEVVQKGVTFILNEKTGGYEPKK